MRAAALLLSVPVTIGLARVPRPVLDNGLARTPPMGWNSWNHFGCDVRLEVGNGGMTDDEYRAHLSLWAIMAAPLIAGNDVRTMSAATRDLLTNTEVIAVDQDSLGIQGTLVSERTQELQVWMKPLKDGSRAVVLLNRSALQTVISASWWRLRISGPARVRDLWSHTDLGTFTDRFSATVPAHGVVMVRVTP